ncbi:hypothetical protein GCM10027275_50140 [Rhabdobacter roseus]|uniref:Uncharacterized protein n=1 Tax=Rhabdobacter roseus TaxID=1655419 RepID=A0A840TRW2_9BACT|nr:hypothetical protein [Rhabdobacter roseus]MBB5287086.1 hypothetical protein [Rhabdobacter roseus]
MKTKYIILLAIAITSVVFSSAELFAQQSDKNKFVRKSNNVVWEVQSVTGERDNKTITIKMSFTNVGELDKAIETYLFTVTDSKGNVYRPDLYGDTSWLFRPNGYSQAVLLSEVPVFSTIHISNFPPSAELITSISLQIHHRFADKPNTPNGQPKSNLLIKNIPIAWE